MFVVIFNCRFNVPMYVICVFSVFTGGWSNNPTALHFKAIFRRLIARTGRLVISSGANVSSLDETDFVKASSISHVPSTCGRIKQNEPSADIDIESVTMTGMRSLGTVVENIVVHMAGMSI